MHIERLDNLGIAMRDLGAAIEFFQTKLGLKVETYLDAEPPSASVHVGDQYLYCFQAGPDTAATPRSTGLVGNPPGIDHISFTVADVDAAYRELSDRGVAFEGEPATDEAWGLRMVAFRDPNGNTYFLVAQV